MNKPQKFIAGIAVAGMLLANCGKNPFGANAPGGLDLFAKIGKALSKPSAINDDEKGKEGSKSMVSDGTGALNRLAKSAATEFTPNWLVRKGIIQNQDNTLTYFEDVQNKPCERNIFKHATGRGEVVFKYSGIYDSATFNPAQITDIVSWQFKGRETKKWNSHVDSIEGHVEFSQGNILDTNNIKPGKTSIWTKNISETLELGFGDTAAFVLDSLDDIKHEQYGSGAFLDAHSGRDDNEPAKAFNFNITLIHKNSHGPNPYLHYEDNEGIMTFTYPWGNTGKNLYFMIHFYPDNIRTGEIREEGPNGALRVSFNHNEITQSGSTTYYDEKGEVISEK